MIKPATFSSFVRAMRSRAIACALLLGAATASAQLSFTIQPSAEAASKDTKIFPHDSGAGFQSNLNITGPDTTEVFSAVLQFDLSSLTALNANAITSAVVRLYATGIGVSGVTGGTGGNVTLSQVIDAWRELSTDAGTAPVASYVAFFGGVDGDFNPIAPTLHFGSPVATQSVTAAGFVSFDITNLVKAWVNGSQANNGLIVQGAADSVKLDIGFADVDSNPAVVGSAPALLVQAVPEPSSMALSVLSVAGVSLLRHRRRRVVTTKK